MDVAEDTRGAALDDRALGQALVQSGRLTETDLARVERMRSSQADEAPLSLLLVKLGLVSERNMAASLAELLKLPLVAAADYPEAPVLEGELSYRFLKEAQLVPLRRDGERLLLAMANPQDSFAAEAVALATDCEVEPVVGVGSEIDSALERMFGEGQSQMGDILSEVAPGEDSEESVELLMDMASGAPVIRLVNLIIQRAVDARASDIHIEPFENSLKVRYRIDGVLKEGEAPPVKMAPAVISRIKIMARLNIAERRLPQDGRIELRVQGQDLDVRVSTVPTMYGESVVMRLLNRENVSLDFTSLGFADDTREALEELLNIPNGMILCTGPTGSGKTTTLYTALHRLNTPERKLITVEDPVEYQLEGINQIQTKSAIGLNFANALRSIVRQDPDVIMVGEMRDLETARICIQSALTGHLVLSTLHTNDAASSVTRLLEMGVEDYLLTSTLNAVIGQRLVRVLCRHCKEAYTPLPEVVAELGLEKYSGGKPVQLYRAVGCSACGGTGFLGRVVIHELLQMNDEIRRLALQHADAGQIQKAARAAGMRTMYEDGCMKALAGVTNLEEVIRVTQET
ncbi:type II secretion system protein E [Marinobacterium nitratireducens]|uniref:Type II secretion system protein E n=1 Tax=Marinobacterium nitratireducens TaxID=518897 RepID=A0A917ZDY7_9GAMM|nr:type II secretion system ATPase GspE [Marinobacterium nitratireducens]GGO80164.1 type II secretion system protein E [Marinobacterium nitratireducens]